MFVVVSYDVPDNKRRTRIMKLLKNFGAHVQYSVFECEVQDQAYKHMRQRLDRLIAPKEDSVRFYFLDEDQVKRIEVKGIGEVVRAQESYVIG